MSFEQPPQHEDENKTPAEKRAERREQYLEHTTLIIPQNDGESVMIGLIADHFGIDVRRIEGSWDLPVDKRDEQLKALADFKPHIVAVESAAPEIEEEWKENLSEDGSFTWIDHHKYPSGLDRSNPGAGSSLEQFLVFFGVDAPEKDPEVKKRFEDFEYSEKFIWGVAVNDEMYVRGLTNENGYLDEHYDGIRFSINEIKHIRAFDRDAQYGDRAEEINRKNEEVFENREKPAENVYILDFGDEREIYTYAKDLALYEHLIEKDGEVTISPFCSFVIRPSAGDDGLYDVAFEMSGYSQKAQEPVISQFHEIAADKNGRPPTSHWWKAKLTAEQVEEAKELVERLGEEGVV